MPIHRGQAIVYHARTMHGSLPNKTDRLRMVTLMGNAPREAPLLFRHRVNDTQIERFVSSHEMYWE
jgi:ectoine hydroxylase-related dioxygenase (phytanoyl-CoA dioxygenase family)